ncbi:MAG: hypothetical protein ISP73_04760 [Flavobacteriales bacterium]|nr:hypothetical protein [Flavobacteriales bacterium]
MSGFEVKIFNTFIGIKTKQKVERFILFISVISFFIHLALIYLTKLNLIEIDDQHGLLSSPIAAIYTPFSFILAYEIYLLIYYLPRSITTYISKQYEIITLIIIRRIFKDISNLDLNQRLFSNESNIQIFLDLGTSLVLFLLIYFFRRNSMKFKSTASEDVLNRFIKIKTWMSTLLVPIIILLASFHFISWISGVYDSQMVNTQMISINNIFFDELFQLLIIVDVLLLLFSFFNSELFHKIMRNSGFIISTILIRISFFTDGISNIILIISSLLFGLLILIIYNECEKRELFKS